MEANAAQRLYEEYKVIYDEKFVKDLINQQEFFLNSLEVVHLAPFNDTSYEVIVCAIREGKVIEFKIKDAIRLFGKSI